LARLPRHLKRYTTFSTIEMGWRGKAKAPISLKPLVTQLSGFRRF